MKVLIVCSKNSGSIAPFIVDQADALKKANVEIDFFTIIGKGFSGYLKCYTPFLKKVKEFKPQIIHAHYSLSGLLANLQRKIPVITTYHGSDINDSKVFVLSKLNMFLSASNIFVSEKNKTKSRLKSKHDLIPCGVDIELFKPIDKEMARKVLGLDANNKYVLFAGAFHNKVKNAELAKNAVLKLKDVTLLELKGYSREQVACLMSAVDTVLMTSSNEGSPQFIKEAMACNCPIVSVNVGDVSYIVENTLGCYICIYNDSEIAQKLNLNIIKGIRTDGRNRIIELGLDSVSVVQKLLKIYQMFA